MTFCHGQLRRGWRLLLAFPLMFFIMDGLAEEVTSQKARDWEEQLDRLRAVPYVDFSDSLVDEDRPGVALYQAGKTHEGYNLYCDKPRGEGLLLDMEGRVVHRWESMPVSGPGKYQHVVMLDNGDLLVIKEHMNLLRLTWDSELVWKKELAAHHDVVQAPDGSIYVLSTERKRHRGIGVNFDLIVHLTEEGEQIDSWSTYDHLAEIKRVLDTRSFLDTILDSALAEGSPQSDGGHEFKRVVAKLRGKLDYFHANTITVLPANSLGEKDSRFQEGNLLVCFRNVNQIAVLEKDSYRLLWAWGEGELDWPHHPTMLEDGHILLFDNGPRRKYSRVLELDPAEATIVWEYTGEPPEDFYSWIEGSSQRLPNGNTLICESHRGRAFEVTMEGEVVWTWMNPITNTGRVGTVYRMKRLPKSKVEELLMRQR